VQPALMPMFLWLNNAFSFPLTSTSVANVFLISVVAANDEQITKASARTQTDVVATRRAFV
jgi:hypothetical protein